MQVKAAPRYSLLTSHARLAVIPPIQIKAAPRYSASDIPCSDSNVPIDVSQSTQVKAAPRYSLLTSHARLAVFPPTQVKTAPRYSASDIPCSASSDPTDASQSGTPATRLLTSYARLAVFPPMQIKAAPRYSASDIPCSASSVPTVTRPACREALPRSRGPAGRRAASKIRYDLANTQARDKMGGVDSANILQS